MQSDWFKVSIRFENDYGFVGFNPANKNIDVQLNDGAKRAEVENYLQHEQDIPINNGSVENFTHRTLLASSGLAEFKAVLTRLWGATGVEVEWSRPVL